MKVLSDPIYGTMKLNDWEEKLLKTKYLHRLQHVHQLGLVYHLYIGANHTKYLDISNLTYSWSTLEPESVRKHTSLAQPLLGSQPKNILTRIPH